MRDACNITQKIPPIFSFFIPAILLKKIRAIFMRDAIISFFILPNILLFFIADAQVF
jgi:hypothetical protein